MSVPVWHPDYWSYSRPQIHILCILYMYILDQEVTRQLV